jgi:predicted ferric reductase
MTLHMLIGWGAQAQQEVMMMCLPQRCYVKTILIYATIATTPRYIISTGLKVSLPPCPTRSFVDFLECENGSIMEDLLYVLAVILVIAWLIGFLGYSAGGLIHILLVIAVIAILLRLIRGRRIV